MAEGRDFRHGWSGRPSRDWDAARRHGLARPRKCVFLKRCTRSLSKPRSHEETMRCRFDPAPEPMLTEATYLAPPCCVSTHRSRVVDQAGSTTFLDHRAALSGILQMTSFPPASGPRARF